MGIECILGDCFFLCQNQAAIKSYPVESIAPSACTGDDGAHLGREG
jgi:hypothetical protein